MSISEESCDQIASPSQRSLKVRERSFRVGRVTVYLRSRIWYLRYHERGKRFQVRAGTDRAQARKQASEVNIQIENGLTASTSFQKVTVADLREYWLEHHESVLRSSLATIARYRTASQHLIDFCLSQRAAPRYASNVEPAHVADFVRYLRRIKVAPNGHANSEKRHLRDKGVHYILEVCRSLFNFAIKRRHLAPYSGNPFTALEVDRVPIEDAKPITLFTREQEESFLQACDDWQRPMFLMLFLTGMRPGELCHLLLPDDVDLTAGVVHIRNKPQLGWKVKTRSERDIPVHPQVVSELNAYLRGRTTGAVFRQRRCFKDYSPPLEGFDRQALEREAIRRINDLKVMGTDELTRAARSRVARTIWRELAAVDEDEVRREFIKVCKKVPGLENQTAPKTLRHGFATMLQDANVDPLVRNLLMGHAPSTEGFCTNLVASLGMTAAYTHTRPSTVRAQTLRAIDLRWNLLYDDKSEGRNSIRPFINI